MCTNPLDELGACDGAGRDTEDDRFRIIDGSAQLRSVQHEEDFQRGMSDSLVAIDNG